MAQDSRRIVTEVDEAIAVIRFNRPYERNPLSLQTLHDLTTVLSELTIRSDVGAIIFTGTDDVFASGANIREVAQLTSTDAFEFSKLGQSIFQRISDARQLTIAAVNGYCMGGALDLALACDIRVASQHAVFAHPGASLGIITGWGGTYRLPRIVGRARAVEFFATARRISSHEALLSGLVTAVADPVLEFAFVTAEKALRAASDEIST